MKSFETLYAQYYSKVYGFLYRLCADGDLAEDLAQETFLQAYTSFYRFRGECEIFTWLAAIGKHVYFKYLKRNKRHLDFANLEFVAQPYGRGQDDPAEQVRRQAVKESVRATVEEMPKKYRDVVLLRIYAELSFSEIGLVLKISENSAKVIFFRAKKMLMEALKDELEL